MKRIRAGTAGLLLLALGGCASMSADECVTSEWHTIGFEDGSRGYSADRLGNHRKACAKHGIAPDLRAYQAGRDEGLREFCQPSRGFNLGASGGSYNGVCSPDLEPEFVDAYRSGIHLYTLRSQVNSANRKISARERELEEIRDRIRETEANLISNDTPTEERLLLLADLKELSERTGQIESDIYGLIDERARREEQLTAYQATLASSGY